MSRLKKQMSLLPGKPYQRLNRETGRFEWVHPKGTNIREVMKSFPDDMISKARKRKEQ